MSLKPSILAPLLIAALSTYAAEQAKSDQATERPLSKPQTHCPVMERYEIDRSQWVDINGKRIYVCCKGCTNQIKANPDKYINRLTKKGVQIEKTPQKEKE